MDADDEWLDVESIDDVGADVDYDTVEVVVGGSPNSPHHKLRLLASPARQTGYKRPRSHPSTEREAESARLDGLSKNTSMETLEKFSLEDTYLEMMLCMSTSCV